MSLIIFMPGKFFYAQWLCRVMMLNAAIQGCEALQLSTWQL
jgi:hypothetical protein